MQVYVIGLQIGYSLVMFVVKLSLFIFYFQLFSTGRRFRILVYVGILSIFTFYTGTAISFGLACIPKPETSWFMAVLAPKFWAETQNRAYLLGVFGVISDFYLYCLPIFVILRLQLSPKKKIGVCAIFMTGSLLGFFLQC